MIAGSELCKRWGLEKQARRGGVRWDATEEPKSFWTLGKINFWFSPDNFYVKFKIKLTNVNPESKFYENSFSSPVEKMRLRVFCVFHEAPLLCTKEMKNLEERSQWQLHHSQPRTLWAKVFLDCSDKSQRCCLPGLLKEELHLFRFRLTLIMTPTTEMNLLYGGDYSFHPREKKMHKPSSSFSFLVLEPLARCWLFYWSLSMLICSLSCG